MHGQASTSLEDRRQLPLLILILAAAAALRAIFFQGLAPSDPYCYAELARKLAEGKTFFDTYNGAAIFPVRIGFYGPVAVFIKAFGLSEASLVAYPYLVSLAGCVLAYLVGRRLFGAGAGLIAAVLLAVLPLDISMASTLFPDPVAAFWANLGLALLILDPEKDGSRRSLLYSAFAGACFGVSWLHKETVLYAGPFVLIYLLQRRSALAHLACVGALSLIFVIGEAAFYRAATGDWLFHFHAMQRNYQQNYVWFFDQASPYFGWAPGGYLHAVMRRLFISGPKAELTSFCFLPALGLAAALWGAARRDSRFVILGLWLATQMFLFNFGSSSLASYRPLPLEYFERYLYPLLLPAALLSGGLLAQLYSAGAAPRAAEERRAFARRRSGAVILAAGLAAILAFSIKDLRPRPLAMIRNVAERVGPSQVVYTDFYTAQFLAYFAQHKILNPDELREAQPITPYEDLSADKLEPGAYVLINENNTDFVVHHDNVTKYVAPDFYARWPANWRLLSRERGVFLFRIEAPSETAARAVASRPAG